MRQTTSQYCSQWQVPGRYVGAKKFLSPRDVLAIVTHYSRVWGDAGAVCVRWGSVRSQAITLTLPPSLTHQGSSQSCRLCSP